MADSESSSQSNPTEGSGIELQIPGNLSGLEYLETIDKIFVKQQVSLCEVWLQLQDVGESWEDKNKYVIEDETGQQVLYAYEESTCWSRSFCGAARALTMHIIDMSGQEIIRVNKPEQMCAGYTCCILGGDCCAFLIQVECPPGRPIGSLAQSCSIWRKPKFVVRDADHNDIFNIRGPCEWPCMCLCCCSCIRDETFRFYSKDGTKIGKCAKKWSGCFKEIWTKADNFSITCEKHTNDFYDM